MSYRVKWTVNDANKVWDDGKRDYQGETLFEALHDILDALADKHVKKVTIIKVKESN